MNTKMNKPAIENYQDYRLYLKDLFDSFKATDPRFSYRYFSQKAGFRSPNFLKLVILGQRNISPASIDRFCEPFKLSQEDRAYFRNLVMMNQADTLEEKNYYAEQIIKSRLYKNTHPLSKAQHHYYAHWYMIPIREMVGLNDFQENPNWIAKRLNPAITTKEAATALDRLLELKLIQRNTAGKLELATEFVTTGAEITASLVPQFHREMMKKASESLDTLPAAGRDISAITAGFSPKKFQEVKQLISKFRKDLLAISDNAAEDAEICQINFQLFPLTKKQEGPK